MTHIIGTYKDFKCKLDTELHSVATGFIKIGYLLKVARDTNVLSQSGYATVADFAKEEYGLTKDVVSRYIAINDRYSKNGYSEELEERYKLYGIAKLAEMLTLPDSIIEEINPKLTRVEIQNIKKEIKAEEQVSDIEVMLEDKPQQYSTTIEKVIHELGYSNKEVFKGLYNLVKREHNEEDVMDVIAPSGIANHIIRVPGVGRIMLSINGRDNPLTLVNIRTQEKELCDWSIAITAIEIVFMAAVVQEYQEVWQLLYGEEYIEEKEEVAPVQPIEDKPKVVEKPIIASPTVEIEHEASQKEKQIEAPVVEKPSKINENEEIETKPDENIAEKRAYVEKIATNDVTIVEDTKVTRLCELVEELQEKAEIGAWNEVKQIAKTLIKGIDEMDGECIE